MQNSIQFEELKQTIVQENEALYGEELAAIYMAMNRSRNPMPKYKA